MKKTDIGKVILFLLFYTVIKSMAQDDNKSLVKQVLQKNQETVDAIAMYPTATRKIIFEASKYPEIIELLSAMQNNSQDAFVKLISSLSKDDQEKIWNLTRYDGLISDLAANPKKTEAESNSVQENIPEPVKKPAVTIPDHFKTEKQPVHVNPLPDNKDTKQKLNHADPNNTNSIKKTENNNQINNAKQYHQNMWKQIQPQQQNYSPAPRKENNHVGQPERQNIQTPANNGRK